MNYKTGFLLSFISGFSLSLAIHVSFFYFSGDGFEVFRNLLPDILFVFSIFATTVSSVIYNKKTVTALYHPLVLFFKLLFSKKILIPPIFFPAGLIFESIIFRITSLNDISLNSFFADIKFLFILYSVNILGAFIGIFLLYRKLSNKNNK